MQGRRRLVETDRAFVFLCSRPIRDLDEYVPGLDAGLPQEVRRAPGPHHALPRQPGLGGRGGEGTPRFEVINLGRNIVSVVGTYGYMEQPDIRGALRELQRRGRDRHPLRALDHRVGEEEIIIGDDLPFLRRLRILLFRLILRLSTPAHKFFGLGYDAGVSKELIPVVFTRAGVKVTLPELEIIESPEVLKPVEA